MSYGVHPVLLRWIHSFLSERKQRIKVGQVVSEWVTLNGGVPQVTKLGCLLFITQINDLQTVVDDSTASEVLKQPTKSQVKRGAMPQQSQRQNVAEDVASWTKVNNMQANPTKTKEFFVCFSKQPSISPQIVMDGISIQRTDCTKGIHLTTDLKWQNQVDEMYAKAARKVYAIIILTKAGLSQQDRLDVYHARIRPVLEYACQVWHPGLTKEQSDSLESIQKRVLKIVYKEVTYDEALELAKLPKLSVRRENMCKKLFE
jgi:hypothetical protein